MANQLLPALSEVEQNHATGAGGGGERAHHAGELAVIRAHWVAQQAAIKGFLRGTFLGGVFFLTLAKVFTAETMPVLVPA